MFRTLCVIVGGALIGVMLLASLIAVGLRLPMSLAVYSYYLINMLTGAVVGLFVGFLQRNRAGFVALVCLSLPIFLQYEHRFGSTATGRRLFFLLLGTILELLVAAIVAQRMSRFRSRSKGSIMAGGAGKAS